VTLVTFGRLSPPFIVETCPIEIEFTKQYRAILAGEPIHGTTVSERLCMHAAPVLLCCFLSGQITIAQTVDSPHAVPEAEARQHLLERSDPIYPAIAQAVRIEGDVGIEVGIDVTGQVASEKIVSGPPMLQQAALDAVKKWQFAPFRVNDTVAPVTTIVTVAFRLNKSLNKSFDKSNAEQEKAAQAWFPLAGKCRSAVKEQNTQDALDYCKQALEMSLAAGDLTSSAQLAMLESRQSYGQALLVAGRMQEALAEENKAIDLARSHLRDMDQEYAMPFYWRAMVEEDLGQDEAASSDFAIAEDTHRRAIAHLPQASGMYSQYLATILEQHAALLDTMGRPADAAKLREEAASL